MAIQENKLRGALLFLRLSVFLVMFMWTLDKFINPDHAARVFDHFYKIGGLGPVVITLIGAVELLIILGFLLGVAKKFTYGVVLVLHAISTLISFPIYLKPFQEPGLLFFAAWPMLAACYALFVLREHDTLCTLGGKRQSPGETGSE